MEDCSQSLGLCRNKQTALHLKIAAVLTILLASSLGVLLPIIGKRLKTLRTDGNVFFVTKAFAAGVILATGFVHMLPDAEEALGSPCLPAEPWAKFPWQGFIAMMAALATLVVDFVATMYYENKHSASPHAHAHAHGHGKHIEELDLPTSNGQIVSNGGLDTFDALAAPTKNGEVGKREDIESKLVTCDTESANGEGPMHIVGMRAHAASHSHNHGEGQHLVVEQNHAGHHHASKHSEEAEISLRHVVISQVLELGIVAHSVIIGLTLGVSQSPCTIRPLMAALVFHQFFEGFALGGCISQAGFKYTSAAVMAFFFAITTPFGICLGIGIASSYNDNSPHALIVEGVLDAISAGILIYTSLVDLIAADFLSKRLRCDRPLQVFSYIALFSGAGAMSGIAIWA